MPRKRTNFSVARLETPGSYVPNTNGTQSPHVSLNRYTGSSTSNLLEISHSNSSHKRAQSVNSHSNTENGYRFPPLKNDLLGDLS